MLKTIFVVYTNSNGVDLGCTSLRKYAFNTSSKVKVGEKLRSNSYDTTMVVTDILDESYLYYDKSIGKLSNKLNSTGFRSIKTIKIAAEASEVIAWRAGKVNE